MARKILHHPSEINISISKPNEKILQLAYVVYDTQKIPLVKYILHQKTFDSVLIFCSSKISVKQLTRELKRTSLAVEEIHSDLDQDKREEVLMYFKSGRIKVLVATDVASRGIDVKELPFVINFDLPDQSESYTHRIGRTGRAGSAGMALSFCSPEERDYLKDIQKHIGQKIPMQNFSLLKRAV